MDYLVYAYLQQGREREAAGVVQRLKAMTNLDEGDFKIAYAATAMPVRYAVERHRWDEAAAIVPTNGTPPHVTAVAVWARGIGLARSGRPAEARREASSLREFAGQLRGRENGEYWARQVGIQVLEVNAWSAQAEGKTDEAGNLLRRAADDEDAIEKLPITPGPILPAREQLADLLLEQKQPALAIKEFQLDSINAPKRRGALVGISQASKALQSRDPYRPKF
jgi:hypothetical protein